MTVRKLTQGAISVYHDQDNTCVGTISKKRQTSRRWVLAQALATTLATLPAQGEESHVIMLSVNRYASLFQGASFQVRIMSKLSVSGDSERVWLQPDDYGRIRLKGLRVGDGSRISVAARLPSSEIFSANCGLGAPSGDMFHVVVQPMSRLDQIVTRTSDRPGHIVETTTPQRVLIGITLQAVAFVPGLSG